MCSRYSLTKEENRIRIRDFEIIFGVVARYNVAPSQKMPVILDANGTPKIQEMKWGLKPVWAKTLWWIASDGLFQGVLNAPDKDELNWHPVNRALNNVRNEGPKLFQ
jgi:putative SOS response-associated peptidase YedK